jgi:DNA-binding response OmpR family regulator/DNA-binding CsgD family transcriptional regulator
VATVLVVDDEPDILEILTLALGAAGHDVLTASDGTEALEIVGRIRPDAMLLDVGMPHMDGWEVLERIKSSGPDLADVPVVMLTAWTSREDRLRGGIEGAVRYLGKPFDPAEVISVVDELLDPGATPEPEMRRQVQRASLEQLARIERGGPDATPRADQARVHLTRLDRPRHPETPAPQFGPEDLDDFLASLPEKQRDVARLVADGIAVGDIATRLGVSRSNVYAILRRVAPKMGAPDGRALIRRLRRIGADAARS